VERRVVLACLNPAPEGEGEVHAPAMPNYGVRRIHAALVSMPDAELDVRVVERTDPDVEAFVDAITASHPHVVGLTTYVWSFPTLFEVARRVRALLPEALIVFGGPSARPEMFELEPYREGPSFIDAVAIREGEDSARALVAIGSRDRARLAEVAGIAVPDGSRFRRTREREGRRDLDDLPSPFELGLMPEGSFGFLETYRGCPLRCSFCEWGEWSNAGRIRSRASLVRELDAIAAYTPPAVFLLDAGLNLNSRAFRLLKEADDELGFFAKHQLITEVYPSQMTDEHLDFLGRSHGSYVGVGLQSFDQAVLAAHDRPFSMKRFERVVRDLTTVSTVELQLILGLPTDSPEGFRETFERTRQLPCRARVYHCLVLPDALMTRGKPEFEMIYDPHTLRMTSCRGFSADALRREAEWLAERARAEGGYAGPFWWSFPEPQGVERPTRRWEEPKRALPVV
jgi:radical SAM superfamily enzyme YgiQ (UPF0313 family)